MEKDSIKMQIGFVLERFEPDEIEDFELIWIPTDFLDTIGIRGDLLNMAEVREIKLMFKKRLGNSIDSFSTFERSFWVYLLEPQHKDLWERLR